MTFLSADSSDSNLLQDVPALPEQILILEAAALSELMGQDPISEYLNDNLAAFTSPARPQGEI